MKQTQPIVAVIESEQDVQYYRDSTGFVFPIGTAILKGDCAGTPTGIRRFENELKLWAWVASQSVGEKLEVTRAPVEVLPEVKTKPVKRKYTKRKAATKKK